MYGSFVKLLVFVLRTVHSMTETPWPPRSLVCDPDGNHLDEKYIVALNNPPQIVGARIYATADCLMNTTLKVSDAEETVWYF